MPRRWAIVRLWGRGTVRGSRESGGPDAVIRFEATGRRGRGRALGFVRIRRRGRRGVEWKWNGSPLDGTQMRAHSIERTRKAMRSHTALGALDAATSARAATARLDPRGDAVACRGGGLGFAHPTKFTGWPSSPAMSTADRDDGALRRRRAARALFRRGCRTRPPVLEDSPGCVVAVEGRRRRRRHVLASSPAVSLPRPSFGAGPARPPPFRGCAARGAPAPTGPPARAGLRGKCANAGRPRARGLVRLFHALPIDRRLRRGRFPFHAVAASLPASRVHMQIGGNNALKKALCKFRAAEIWANLGGRGAAVR